MRGGDGWVVFTQKVAFGLLGWYHQIPPKGVVFPRIFFYLFIYLGWVFVAAPALILVPRSWGSSLVGVLRLLPAVPSLATELRF